MSYFRELPDLEYQSPLSHKISSREYVRVKNLFRRVKLLDWLQDKTTLFRKYQIEEGERPDIVAEKLFGSVDYDWVVLLTANIINVRDQWPLSNRDLYVYAENKYTIANLSEIHHYETIEVKDSKGRLILLGGQIVDSNFTIPNPNQSEISPTPTPTPPPTPEPPPPEPTNTTSTNQYFGVTPTETIKYTGDTINPVIGVTNYEYESKLNEEKRQIYVLKEGYLQQFLNDMRVIMHYDRSSQYVDKKLIRTENTRLIGP